MEIRPEETDFVDRAKAFTSNVGPESVLLLVGSRAAGFDDAWSDLDMWVIGDKGKLSAGEREKYPKDVLELKLKAFFLDFTCHSQVL